MKGIFTLILGLCAACVLPAVAADALPDDAFRVLPTTTKAEAPSITPYLRYQTAVAWQQDEERRKAWEGIRTEEDLLRVQRSIEKNLLAMLGGLPVERTPLHPRITGKFQMDGFHIEKLIFESLPGVYVTALVYVPDDGNKRHPGILVPSGHSSNGKNYYQALCQRLVQRGYVVICWDPVGQGERSQFWDAKAGNSRYKPDLRRACGAGKPGISCGYEPCAVGNLGWHSGGRLPADAGRGRFGAYQHHGHKWRRISGGAYCRARPAH